MDDLRVISLGACRRWFYTVAFAIARSLVVGGACGPSPHRKTRRREAVLSLGDPEQRPIQVRGSRRRRGSRRGTRRE